MASASVLKPTAPAVLKFDRVDRAPNFCGNVQFIHHFHREQFVRHGQIESGEVHRLRAFDGGAEIFWIHFKRKITPVQSERGERGVVHRGRRGMRDGRAIDRAQARGGVDGGLNRIVTRAIYIRRRREFKAQSPLKENSNALRPRNLSARISPDEIKRRGLSRRRGAGRRGLAHVARRGIAPARGRGHLRSARQSGVAPARARGCGNHFARQTHGIFAGANQFD